MEFFNSAIEVLQTLVVALGAGLGVWGAINLLEGYGNDNPGSKSQGMKQLMAGGGVADRQLLLYCHDTIKSRSSASPSVCEMVTMDFLIIICTGRQPPPAVLNRTGRSAGESG